MTYEEEIICHCCGSEYKITYQKDKLTTKILFCSCCGEELTSEEEFDEYIEGDTDEDE